MTSPATSASATIRVATRASRLALWQAEHVASLIRSANSDIDVDVVHVRTEGDQNQSEPLRDFGGAGVFTREVQKAVLDHRCDVAVHSLKDLPTQPTDGLILAAIPGRAPRCDALVLPEAALAITELGQLAGNARIGTGSPRRQAQLQHFCRDFRLREIRGNVETRLRKLDEGEFDAIVLAEAGLRRLGLADRITLLLHPPLMYPAVGQGAIGIECRVDDEQTRQALDLISHPEVRACLVAERSLLSDLRAGCHAPLGAWSELAAGDLTLTGVLLSTDGVHRLEATATGAATNASDVGSQVAQALLAAGGKELVAQYA